MLLEDIEQLGAFSVPVNLKRFRFEYFR